jgi:tripartite-type tricarboxylate transporter receptor subunit TctC
MPKASSRGLALGLAVGFAVSAALPASAQQSVADFYKGKQIEFLTGGAAGNVYDVWVRLLGRHWGKQIPGNPTFLTKNMPGAGHLTATNHLYNQSARDGTVVAMNSRNMVTQDLLEVAAVKFKVTEFAWLGSPEQVRRVCVAKAGAKVQKVEDLYTQELQVGGAGAGSAVSNTPILINKLLGLKLKLVEGYQTGPQIFLAMERGEVDGVCQTLSAIESSRPGWIKEGKLKILFNMEKNPLPGVAAPSIHSIAKTDEQRSIISFYNSNAELGRPINTTQGVPKERVEALRRSFDATMKDKGFREDAEKSGVQVEAMTGEQVEAVVKQIMATPKAIVAKTIEIVGSLGE